MPYKSLLNYVVFILIQRGIYSKGKSRCYVKKNQTTCETASEQGYYKVIHLPQNILGNICNPVMVYVMRIIYAQKKTFSQYRHYVQ